MCLPLSAEFVIELVKRLDVRYDGIRIGAVIYSNFAENKIFMNTEFDKNLLLQASANAYHNIIHQDSRFFTLT